MEGVLLHRIQQFPSFVLQPICQKSFGVPLNGRVGVPGNVDWKIRRRKSGKEFLHPFV